MERVSEKFPNISLLSSLKAEREFILTENGSTYTHLYQALYDVFYILNLNTNPTIWVILGLFYKEEMSKSERESNEARILTLSTEVHA